MLFADEVIPAEDLDIPDVEEPSDRELTMAQQLIDSLTIDFDPTRYKDEYREKVLEMIEQKAAGAEITVQPQVEEPAPVVDLMAALEASLASARGETSDGKTDKKAKGATGSKRNTA